MAEFTFTGVDKSGKKVIGKMDAPTEGELRVILRGQGIRPMRIAKAGILQSDLGTMLRGGGVKVRTAELAAFTRQMYVLVGSGIPLVQALEILGEQSDNPGMKKVLLAIKEKVSGGAFFWESMATYTKVFPRIYVALCRAGESSGALEAILNRLAMYLEDTDRLAKQVKSAMMYPAIVVLVGVGVVTGMLMFVIPKFESIIVSSGQELPAITQAVIKSSHFMGNNFVQIAGGIGLLSFLFMRYAKSDEGRGIVDRLLIRMPIFGSILQKAGIARFTRTLGTLMASGVNLIDAIDICKNTVDNVVIEEAVGKIRKEVETGKNLSMVLSKMPIFPKMTVQMVAVGESTGNLEKMLDRVAAIYESDVQTLVGGLSKLIEPIILVVLGGLIAVMMIAMYLPIFKMAGGTEGG